MDKEKAFWRKGWTGGVFGIVEVGCLTPKTVAGEKHHAFGCYAECRTGALHKVNGVMMKEKNL